MRARACVRAGEIRRIFQFIGSLHSHFVTSALMTLPLGPGGPVAPGIPGIPIKPRSPGSPGGPGSPRIIGGY